jgi:ceramide glucosyltransferase
MQIAVQVVAGVCALLALAGAAYYGLCTWAGMRFLSQRRKPAHYAPPVSIMKSLKGVDPHMRAAFRSHCVLDYPEYEVLFGVSDLRDPAAALVGEMQAEFPGAKLRIVHCPEVLGANGKVSNLAQMLPHARYEHVLINDSDILVQPDFLRRAICRFADAKVGVVTTLYRAVAGRSLESKLEALGISTDFMGGVLVARELEGGIKFALGATMATTKSVLATIGGLEPLVDVLGDDYELGARAAAAGYRVELADAVVETALADYSWQDFWQHQLRWARNIKDRRTSQYFGLIVTFGLAWGILAVLASPIAWWTWTALALVAASRYAAAMVIGGRVLQPRHLEHNSLPSHVDGKVLPIPIVNSVEDEQNVTNFRVYSDYVNSLSQSWRDLWLIPVRDFVALGVWIASFFGNTIVWRGERFRLRDGKLTPLS